MGVVCLIPARGGSKRIPRKNVKLFSGRPMISYSIEAALKSSLFDRVIVSTDDDEIAAISVAHGAEVPFRRPPDIASDTAGTDAVLVHALRWLESSDGLPEFACCIYPTAPLLEAADLQRGFKTIKSTGAVTAFSVTSFPYTIFRALRINDAGRAVMFWPENFARRSQDLPEAWHDAGQFYWLHVSPYLAEQRLFSSDSVPIYIPRHRVQDIDTPEDWEVAEKLYTLSSAAEISKDWKKQRAKFQ